jgi:hypothetical protein
VEVKELRLAAVLKKWEEKCKGSGPFVEAFLTLMLFA